VYSTVIHLSNSVSETGFRHGCVSNPEICVIIILCNRTAFDIDKVVIDLSRGPHSIIYMIARPYLDSSYLSLVSV